MAFSFSSPTMPRPLQCAAAILNLLLTGSAHTGSRQSSRHVGIRRRFAAFATTQPNNVNAIIAMRRAGEARQGQPAELNPTHRATN